MVFFSMLQRCTERQILSDHAAVWTRMRLNIGEGSFNEKYITTKNVLTLAFLINDTYLIQ